MIKICIDNIDYTHFTNKISQIENKTKEELSKQGLYLSYLIHAKTNMVLADGLRYIEIETDFSSDNDIEQKNIDSYNAGATEMAKIIFEDYGTSFGEIYTPDGFQEVKSRPFN